ncbi:hypothetical protein A3D77_05480 [Candidatus Gottesmanbacteria bacterium RIFCSPHIGHO2_02_FULL_39_11]|uniref:Uncharacterized protein n=1 Tax=Candidatus Gottesmanbacteria bacterium RIFCSPHIGHO2_02_FULL_39_11 TaxID=1798382 RepID=A0A1F5ZLT1_9BACT|nr:MAG: hypothetical protein A3D77_05480 [Candidatus Gottesmanbacteria bacterium RIFCSPHIGHO2_02_FULL_39_11]
MKSNKKFYKKILAVSCILIIIISSLILTLRKKSTENYSANASVPLYSVCQNDRFLCDSLVLMTEEKFIDRIYSGTISSFDGSTHVTKTWQRDPSDNYIFTSADNNVETDRVIRTDGISVFKNNKTSKWQINQEDKRSDTDQKANNGSIVEQMGIDETIGSFLMDSPVRNNFSFLNLGTQNCNGVNCIEYQALDKTTTIENKKEYLYFDSTTHQFLKYVRIIPEFQVEYTFSYTSPSPIVLPSEIQ